MTGQPTSNGSAPAGASGADKAWGFLKTFMRRVFVHFCAFIGAGVIVNVHNAALPPGTWTLFISSYLAIICLVPRPRNGVEDPDYSLPIASGVGQSIIALCCGMPFSIALFVGGLQTYLQRYICYRKNFGFEYAVLPFLLIAVLCWSEYFFDSSFNWWGLVTVPLVALAVQPVRRLFSKLRARKLKRGRLEQLLKRLDELGHSSVFKAELKTEVLALKDRAQTYLQLQSSKLNSEDENLKRIGNLGVELDALERSCHGLEVPQSFAFLQRQSGHGKLDLAFETAREKLVELNRHLDLELGKLKPEDQIQDEFTVYDNQARELLNYKASLPYEMGQKLEHIAQATADMLKLMREDERDRGPGESFLKRYLKATQGIVEEYIRLKTRGVESETLNEALKQAAVVLGRLEEAFVDECKFLLDNDTVNFKAELNALDTFMQMRGH
ncbi:MAG: 5-bromo-4-chloroindolyl phosphate hydrolysis family protein [Succinivibrio sp.]|nr:5-bromo-4-chloroindolyl phosphate hydrolysis family protein [Succinivibrio sp.]